MEIFDENFFSCSMGKTLNSDKLFLPEQEGKTKVLSTFYELQ